MIRRFLILIAVVYVSTISGTAQGQALPSSPLPCTTEKRDPTQPWVHNAAVLSSFPKDKPLPRYIGAFRDRRRVYQIVLFEDGKGIFGELLSPVLDADSPTSRLYDAHYKKPSGVLDFSVKLRNQRLLFSGVFRGRVVRGTFVQNDRKEKVTLKRINWNDNDQELAYTSRAQFECAMILFGRY